MTLDKLSTILSIRKAEDIWRLYQKQYQIPFESLGERKENESPQAFTFRHEDLIKCAAVRHAFAILEHDQLLPTFEATGAVIDRSPTWVFRLFERHPELRNQAIKIAARIKKIEILEAAVRILERESSNMALAPNPISRKRLVAEVGRSRGYIADILRRHPDIVEILGLSGSPNGE